MIENARWLAAGFLLTFMSSFGQTYFIALFSGQIRGELGLSHGQFGTVYGLATLSSAVALIWVGKLADRENTQLVAVFVCIMLAAGAFGMTIVTGPVVLFFTIFVLRLFGQGMMTHVSQTAIGRWFVARRGKALAVTGFGFPTSEAVLPAIVVLLVGAAGWRSVWMMAVAVLLLVAAPVFWFLLGKGRTPLAANAVATGRGTAAPRNWTRHEVVRDRLEREYGIDLITTAPSVVYHIFMRDGTMRELHNPADMPDLTHVDHLEEPRIKATILAPDDYLGDVLKLCQDRRGIQLDLTYAGSRAMVVYDLPLNEVVFDFYDRLKSVSKGYASFDYQLTGYREDSLVKMQILVNDEPVDALSVMVHRDRAETRGRAMVEKLKDLIPRHMFKIPIQAAIGGKVIARETLSALRKDVTAKCYGGDATRKRKLLDKQKAGKKKMRQFGKVDIPQEAFISALKMDN